MTNVYCWYSSSQKTMRFFYSSYKLSRKVPCMGSYARAPSWISVDNDRFSTHNYGSLHRLVVIYQKLQCYSNIPGTQTVLPWKNSFFQNPMKKLETALEEDNHVDDGWEVFSSYNRLHGFPKKHVVTKMISLMTRSLKPHWLLKAHELVLMVVQKSPHLLDHDSLTRLALILARNQMPVPASTIMRITLNRFKFPSLDILGTMFFHLVKSDIGSYLASNILIEICEITLNQMSKIRRDSNQPKMFNPNVTIFNLVLDSCSKFVSFQRALRIIKLMSDIGVVADANSIVIFARIFEKIGRRDELVRLKVFVDSVSSATFSRHYCPFYDSLLSLHFKYNDLDAAAKIILELFSPTKSLKNGKIKTCSLQIGSDNLTMGYKVSVQPELLGSDFIVDSSVQYGLVLYSDGKLLPSTKALARLINGFVKAGRVREVSNLLIDMENKIVHKGGSFSTSVLVAFIKLGWLGIVHDVLDDLDLASISVEAILYRSLFQAYCKKNLFKESELLLTQMKKKGISGEEAVESSVFGDFPRDKLYLEGDLYSEVNEGDAACYLVYEFNATVLFFCQAGMMEDAIRTVKKMQQKNVQPTNLTFSYLLDGYSSLKMYRQITILWGEIKRRLENGVLIVDQELLDCLLMNFLRGGYFGRIMEIANFMTRHNVFADKWKYKDEFLKLHGDLYRRLKSAYATTDAQRMRLEHVQAFKKWVNISKL